MIGQGQGQGQHPYWSDEGKGTTNPAVDSELKAVEQVMGILPPGPHLRYMEYRPRERRRTGDTSTNDAAGATESPPVLSSSNIYLPTATSVTSVLDQLKRVIEREGPFDGIMGHSEGASVAATLLLRQRERGRGDSGSRSWAVGWKCAIFFNGWPPYTNEETDEGKGEQSWKGERLLLPANPDCLQDQVLIPISTCHVMSARDPTNARAVALYRLCAAESAKIVGHSKGHVIPNAPKTLERVADFVRGVVGSSSSLSSKGGMEEGGIKTIDA